MNSGVNGLAARETSFVRLYMELTGASESMARSVFMHVCEREVECGNPPGEYGINAFREEKAVIAPFRRDVNEASGWLNRTVAVPVPG